MGTRKGLILTIQSFIGATENGSLLELQVLDCNLDISLRGFDFNRGLPLVRRPVGINAALDGCRLCRNGQYSQRQ